jgi:hypothetical protein
MSGDEQEPEGSPRPFIRRLTLPRRPIRQDSFSRGYDSYDSDEEGRAPYNSKKTRGYYDSDSSLYSSAEDEESNYGYSRPRRKRRHHSREKNAVLILSSHADANTVYPFSLPGHHHRQQLFTEDGSTKGSDDTDSEKAESSAESSSIWHRTVKDVQHVYSARYTGEKVLHGGLQSAELKTSQYDGKSSQTPLFQWMYGDPITMATYCFLICFCRHFQDSDMNFEVFQDRVDHVQGLTTVQRTAIFKLLRKVKNKYDSPLKVANHPSIRIMQPGFLTGVVWPVEEQTATQRNNRTTATNVAWICFPYFSLDQYQGLFSNPKKGAHPMHTLLQTRSSLISMKREIKQAVCQVGDNEDKLCFHVGQLWCLVIGDCEFIN